MDPTLFYWIKCVLSLIATGLLGWHMYHVKDKVSFGRWLRYLMLLYFAILLTYGSVEQVSDHIGIAPRNIGGMLGAVLLILTAVVSIREQKKEDETPDADEIIRRMRGSA